MTLELSIKIQLFFLWICIRISPHSQFFMYTEEEFSLAKDFHLNLDYASVRYSHADVTWYIVENPTKVSNGITGNLLRP